MGVRLRLLLFPAMAAGFLLDACDDRSTAEEPAGDAQGETIVSWRNARKHVGEIVTVEGKVVSTHVARRETGAPTFVNIGHDYPDPARFVVVIWSDDRKKFPEPPRVLYSGKVIQVTGRIQTYEGVPQVVVESPQAIEIVSPPHLWTRPNLE